MSYELVYLKIRSMEWLKQVSTTSETYTLYVKYEYVIILNVCHFV